MLLSATYTGHILKSVIKVVYKPITITNLTTGVYGSSYMLSDCNEKSFHEFAVSAQQLASVAHLVQSEAFHRIAGLIPGISCQRTYS
jgi:hypothetical protein